MARILSIDYGLKRCGIAATDPLQIAVHPIKVVSPNDLRSFLDDYFSTEEVEKIVIGKPSHADGTVTHLWEYIQKLEQDLKKKYPHITIDFEDESFSSVEAKKIMLQSGMKKKKRRIKENVDLISAVIILQRYLKHI